MIHRWWFLLALPFVLWEIQIRPVKEDVPASMSWVAGKTYESRPACEAVRREMKDTLTSRYVCLQEGYRP